MSQEDNKELYDWLQQNWKIRNHNKYQKYFKQWVSNITENQIEYFTKEMNKDLINEIKAEIDAPVGIIFKALKETNENKVEAIKIIQKELSNKAKKVQSKRADVGDVVSTSISEEEKYKGSLVVVDDNLIESDGRVTAIKITTITDFAVKNKELINFADVIVGICSSRKIYTVDELLKEQYSDDLKVSDKLTELIGTIGENIIIKDIRHISSNTPTELATFKYYNHQSKYLSMICWTSELQESKEETMPAIKEIETRLLNHIIFHKPLVVKEKDLPQKIVSEQKKEAEKAAEGKPDKVKQRIIDGAYGKFLDKACLDRQLLLGDEDKNKNERKDIRQYLDEYKINIIDFDYIV